VFKFIRVHFLRTFCSAALLFFLTSGAAGFLALHSFAGGTSKESAAIMISGGGTKDDNNYRYENNVRLFYNILSEHSYSRDQVRVFFNEGVESQVRDFDSLPQNITTPYHEYGIKQDYQSVFRLNRVRDIINGPAKPDAIKKEFDRIAEQARAGKVKRAVLFVTDHGTANTNDYKQSFITLAGDEKLTVGEQELFVQKLAPTGANVALVGVQCYSGHNMEIAMRHPNACAFSAAAPFETSYAMSEDQIPKGSEAPALGYSTYSFFFSCAQHDPKIKTNQAAAHCPETIAADFNSDHKVSLAEAHFYAMSKMTPLSTPQISSQFYAHSVLDRKGKKLSPEDLALFCTQETNQLSAWVDKLGDSFDPALKMRIEARLAMERQVLTELMSDDELLKKIKAKKEESLESKLKKLQTSYNHFNEGYQTVQVQIRSAMSALNSTREQRTLLKERVLQNLIETGSDPKLKASHEGIKVIEKKLENSALSDEERQITQNAYNKHAQTIKKAVNAELKNLPYSVQEVDLTRAIERQQEDMKLAEDRESTYNNEYSRVRRAHEALSSYHAELEIMKTGSTDEKAKLVQLYGCEDQIL